MWYGPLEYAEHSQIMGADYKANRAGMRPLWVRLPNGDAHCVDGASYDGTTWGAGWVVTGEPPTITISPSINYQLGKGWHGWIRDGVITDDCEGRTYL